ncbi:hypothetical protein I3842_Q027100, partial [Carya illinoinensis]
SNPFRLDNGDNLAIILVIDLLTNDNYMTWSCAMRWALCAKNNDMVISWLQTFISSSIKSSIVFVDNARDIWLDLQHSFSQQNHDSVSTYYGKLKTLWNELSIYDPILTCNCGSTKTLLDRYVHDRLMLLDPLPPVTKVFSLIHQQEKQHQLISTIPSPDSIALAIKKPYPPTTTSHPSGNAKAPICSHCHLSGHKADKCYKLHGYLLGYKFFSKSPSP